MHKKRNLAARVGLSIIGVLAALTMLGITQAVIRHLNSSEVQTGRYSRKLTEDYKAVTRENIWTEANKHRDDPLPLDPILNRTAQEKCDRIAKTGEPKHGDLSKDFGSLGRRVYGENLAENFATASDVVDAWANSPTHYKNLIDSDWRRVGYGICYNSKLGTVVVQHFSD
jgi:uncharacterized protein YkwD